MRRPKMRELGARILNPYEQISGSHQLRLASTTQRIEIGFKGVMELTKLLIL